MCVYVTLCYSICVTIFTPLTHTHRYPAHTTRNEVRNARWLISFIPIDCIQTPRFFFVHKIVDFFLFHSFIFPFSPEPGKKHSFFTSFFGCFFPRIIFISLSGVVIGMRHNIHVRIFRLFVSIKPTVYTNTHKAFEGNKWGAFFSVAAEY